jgi:hypothetical protein
MEKAFYISVFGTGERGKKLIGSRFPDEFDQFPEGENICFSNTELLLRLASTSGIREDCVLGWVAEAFRAAMNFSAVASSRMTFL